MTLLSCLERIRVPIDVAGGTWGAAIVLAVLAFPESAQKRKQFLQDIKAWFVRNAVRRGWPREKAKKHLLSRPRRALEVSGPIVTAGRRISRERLPAASIATDVIVQQVSADSWLRFQPMRGEIPVRGLRSAFAGLAAQRRVSATSTRGGMSPAESHATNFRTRAWRKSIPVLHIAMALRLELEELSPGEVTFPSVPDLVRDPRWLPGVLAQAERLRQMLALFPKIRAPIEQTISVLLDKK
jgi:hypothetical protein